MPDITTQPFRVNGRSVYADGALLGCYWPDKAPRPGEDTSHQDALCEPGIHKKLPFHAYPLFSIGPATHHETPEAAMAALLASRDRPNREQVEIYDSLRHPDEGVPEAVRYARRIIEDRTTT